MFTQETGKLENLGKIRYIRKVALPSYFVNLSVMLFWTLLFNKKNKPTLSYFVFSSSENDTERFFLRNFSFDLKVID